VKNQIIIKKTNNLYNIRKIFSTFATLFYIIGGTKLSKEAVNCDAELTK
jgi:hypothetical protein